MSDLAWKCPACGEAVAVDPPRQIDLGDNGTNRLIWTRMSPTALADAHAHAWTHEVDASDN